MNRRNVSSRSRREAQKIVSNWEDSGGLTKGGGDQFYVFIHICFCVEFLRRCCCSCEKQAVEETRFDGGFELACSGLRSVCRRVPTLEANNIKHQIVHIA